MRYPRSAAWARVLRIALSLSVISTAAVNCASIEGARFYASGTKALEAEQTERAIADLERAAALVPEASEVQNHLGIAYQAAGRHAEAISAFERAVELDCDNQAAQLNLDRLRLRLAREAHD